jgi:hypothetical protein
MTLTGAGTGCYVNGAALQVHSSLKGVIPA